MATTTASLARLKVIDVPDQIQQGQVIVWREDEIHQEGDLQETQYDELWNEPRHRQCLQATFHWNRKGRKFDAKDWECHGEWETQFDWCACVCAHKVCGDTKLEWPPTISWLYIARFLHFRWDWHNLIARIRWAVLWTSHTNIERYI